jgi:hypothetical protein
MRQLFLPLGNLCRHNLTKFGIVFSDESKDEQKWVGTVVTYQRTYVRFAPIEALKKISNWMKGALVGNSLVFVDNLVLEAAVLVTFLLITLFW